MPKRMTTTSHTPGLGSSFIARDTDGDSLHIRLYNPSKESKKLDRDCLVECRDLLDNGVMVALSREQLKRLRDFLVEHVA